MADLIKVRIKRGAAEIEIEGAHAIVEAALEKWWPRLYGATTATDEADEGPPEPVTRIPKSQRRRAKRAPSSGPNERPRFDPTPWVNKMKEDSRFTAFEEKVLHKSDRLNKILLVCWFVDQPLTSGEIQKILVTLGVKLSLAHVSTALSSNSSSFITTGQRQRGGEPIRYTLTGKAKKDFETWFQNGKPGA